jgi:hypothetical protein
MLIVGTITSSPVPQQLVELPQHHFSAFFEPPQGVI